MLDMSERQHINASTYPYVENVRNRSACLRVRIRSTKKPVPTVAVSFRKSMRVFGRVTSKNCQTMMISIDMLVHDLTIYFIYIILFKKWQANTRLTANVFLEIEWTAGVINLSKDIVAPAALLALQCGEQASNCKARKRKRVPRNVSSKLTRASQPWSSRRAQKALKMTYEGQRPLHACGCHLSSTQQ